MCQARCVQQDTGLWNSDQLQPGLLAGWCFFLFSVVCFLFLCFWVWHSIQYMSRFTTFFNGLKAPLTSCHSVLAGGPPISFSWKRLWLLSNSECEPKAGHSMATPPSARISIDKVTCCSLACSLSLHTWKWSTALSAESSVWCWYTVAHRRDCQPTPGIHRIPRGGDGSCLLFPLQPPHSGWLMLLMHCG